MSKVLITTVPFGDKDRLPIDRLEAEGIQYVINPLGRKLKEAELAEMIADFDVLIAGTEQITDKVMESALNLRLISRVGVGLDSVNLAAARRRGIKVSYTPDAPAPAVAELTIGLVLSLLRFTHVANAQLHRGVWERHFGQRLSEMTIGVIGAGRIGGRVVKHLSAFGVKKILVNDLAAGQIKIPGVKFDWADKDEIYRDADVITVHVPLTAHTKDMICDDAMRKMKRSVRIINTARGGIVNEVDLASALKHSSIGGAAIDVFCQEPYSGPLSRFDSCLLTSHLGSMSVDCRTRMEIEATEEAIRYLRGQELLSLVPDEEYDAQAEGL